MYHVITSKGIQFDAYFCLSNASFNIIRIHIEFGRGKLPYYLQSEMVDIEIENFAYSFK